MRTAALGSVMLVLAMSGMAQGQNALDKPLDRNLQKGSGGLNTSRGDFVQELKLRNAIVTGNAPGGLSFRGNVGYKAPGEFFSSLGSNDTFAFRRDSYYSGLGGLGIRGTDALQYQFAMTTGNAPPPGFSGLPAVTRSGASVNALNTSQPATTGAPGTSGARPTGGGISITQPDPTVPGSDLRGLTLMSLRSPSAYMASRGLEPSALGRITGEDGKPVGVTASSLRGISFDANLGAPRAPEAPTVPNPGAPTNLNQKISDMPIEKKIDERLDAKPAAAPGRSSYDDLVDRLKLTDSGSPAEKAEEKKGIPSWQLQLEDLRRQLNEPKDSRPGEKPIEKPKPKEDADKLGGKAGERAGEKEPEKKEDLMRPETLEMIRGAGAKVDTLVLPGYDPYASHMKAAQDLMAGGRYFYAEERYTAALAIKSGDPMAAIGRVHAQLGASMFLSASINLRALFTEHPEVTTLKYGGDILPPPDRMKVLIERLGEQAESKDGKRRDSAFLMAYLAFQSGDVKAMKRGLEIMGMPSEPKPGEKIEGPDQLQKLSGLLTAVWNKPADPVPGK